MEFQLLKGKLTIDEVKQLNPLVLALIGDAVYEVFIRTYLVEKNRGLNVHKLHVKTVSYLKAEGQSEFMKVILDDLEDDEMAIFKRGRNCKSHAPKNADVTDYRWATGFESLIGYLYLTEKEDRLIFILNKIIYYEEEKDDING